MIPDCLSSEPLFLDCKLFETLFLESNNVDIINLDLFAPKLKPLILASLVDFDEGSLFSNNLEVDVEHLDNFSLVDSNLRDLGFISPIKVLKGNGSGYFLRSCSKVLLDHVSSLGSRVGLTTELSKEGSAHSGALRAVDAHLRVSL